MTRVRIPLSTLCCSSLGSSDFLALVDTPDSYAGYGGMSVKVKSTEDGLEFGGVVAGGLDAAVANTAGGVITLDMNAQPERMFRGSADITSPKTWALGNVSSALLIPSVKFTIGIVHPQTFPIIFKMASFDANWNSASKVWTPPDVGTYEMSAAFDGVNWLMKIQGPY